MPPPRRKPKALPGKSTRGLGKPKAQPSQTKCCDNPSIEDREDGKICINCFTQISEQNIVADVTFEETANGAAAVQGSLVGANARHGNTFGNNPTLQRMGGGEGMSTWEKKRKDGEDDIRRLARDVKVTGESVILEAVRLWGLAINANFTAGRTVHEAVGACFYAACRRDEHNTILLIDVAEQQRINVFRLGECYKAFCRVMYIQQKELTYKQMIDIEPLILKYCGKLEFGPDTGKVAEDALKIMRRMKRDWIVPGRHPSGLCGACIILAARMNNYKRTVREIVYVAKIADVTVAKRIEEFRRTKSAALTVNQFRKYANRLKHQHDPPAIHETELRLHKLQKLKRKRQAARNEENGDNDAIFIDDEVDGSSAAGSPAPGEAENEDRRKRSRTSSQPADASAQQEPRFDADGFAIPARPVPIDPALLEQPAEGSDAESPPKKRGRGRPKKVAPVPVEISEEELLLEEELQSDIVKALEEPELNAIAEERERLIEEKLQAESEERSAKLRMLEAQKIQERRSVAGIVWHNSEEHNLLDKPTPEQLEFEFKDDPEVENCILNEQARREKEKIWLYHNEDWLRAQYEKELLKKIADAKGKAPKKRGSRKGKKKGELAADQTPAATPLDAANNMLANNAPPGFSRFVDYEALSKVYGHESSADPSRANSVAPSASQDDAFSRQSSPAVSGARASPGPPTPDRTQQSPRNARQATSSAAPNMLSPPPTQAQNQAEPGATAAGEEDAAAEEEDDDDGDAADEEDDEEEQYRRAHYPGEYDEDDEMGGYGDDDYDEAVDPMGGHSLEGTF